MPPALNLVAGANSALPARNFRTGGAKTGEGAAIGGEVGFHLVATVGYVGLEAPKAGKSIGSVGASGVGHRGDASAISDVGVVGWDEPGIGRGVYGARHQGGRGIVPGRPRGGPVVVAAAAEAAHALGIVVLDVIGGEEGKVGAGIAVGLLSAGALAIRGAGGGDGVRKSRGRGDVLEGALEGIHRAALLALAASGAGTGGTSSSLEDASDAGVIGVFAMRGEDGRSGGGDKANGGDGDGVELHRDGGFWFDFAFR